MKRSTIWRRVTAFLCTLVLLLGEVPHAHAAEILPTITVSSVSVTQGGTCYVNVYGKDLDNLGALQFVLNYDAAVFAVTSATGYNMDVANVNTDTASEVRFSGMKAAGVSGSSVLLMQVSLRAASDAEIGEHALDLSVGIAVDINSTGITFAKEPGTITVNKAEPLRAYFSGSVSPNPVEAGERVAYTLSSYNLGGMAAGQFSFTYDSNLLVFEDGQLLSGLDKEGCIYSVNSGNPGNVTLSWAAQTGAATTGQLLQLTFRAAASASGAASITCTPMTLSSENMQVITASAATTNLTITEKQISESDPALWLTVPENLTVCEEFIATVSVEGRSGLAAADFSVSYDADLLECISVSVADGAEDLITVNKTYHSGRVRFSLFCNGGIDGDLEMVEMTFRSKVDKGYTAEMITLVTDPVNNDLQTVILDCQKTEFTVAGHEYDAGIVTTAPTCTRDGVKIYTCDECCASYTEAIDATGHSYDSGVVTEPTCTAEGYTTYTCTVCGDFYTADEKDALGHTIGTATAENEVGPDCDDAGSYDSVTYCTVCDVEISREEIVVPALGHTAVITPAVAPDCDSTGLTEGSHCGVCGKVLVAQKVVDVLNHTSGEAVTENEKAANCAVDGSYDTVVYCTICNTELSRKTTVVSATGEHNYTVEVEGTKVPATCMATGSVTMKCVCGAAEVQTLEIDKSNHTKQNTTVQGATEASCSTDGYTGDTYCECGETIADGETIPATGHKDTNGDYICDVCTKELCTNHNPEVVPGYGATCTESGLTDGVKCSKCGDVIDKQEIIPAKGHSYQPTFKWQSDFSAATVNISCTCGDGQNTDCQITTEWEQASGTLKFTASAVVGNVPYSDTQTIRLTVSGGKLTITNSAAGAEEKVNMIIMVAGYNGDQMTGCQVITNITCNTTETLMITGQLKVFFLKSDGSYAPLFECAGL